MERLSSKTDITVSVRVKISSILACNFVADALHAFVRICSIFLMNILCFIN